MNGGSAGHAPARAAGTDLPLATPPPAMWSTRARHGRMDPAAGPVGNPRDPRAVGHWVTRITLTVGRRDGGPAGHAAAGQHPRSAALRATARTSEQPLGVDQCLVGRFRGEPDPGIDFSSANSAPWSRPSCVRVPRENLSQFSLIVARRPPAFPERARDRDLCHVPGAAPGRNGPRGLTQQGRGAIGTVGATRGRRSARLRLDPT